MSPVEQARPDLGLLVPGWSVRVLFAVVAVALCVGLAQPGFWLSIALLLTIAAVVVPRSLSAWFLIGVLSFSVLLREQSVTDWRAYALIAGAHALHVLGSWMLVVRPSSSLQPAALWPSARRFLLIQVPVQLVAAGALALTGAAGGRSLLPLAIVAGAGIVALTVALAAPLVRRPSP
jgi:hypothetical protein